MDRIIKRVDFPKIMQPQALKVCAYTRVSSGKNAMLHSLSAQISHYSEMIQSHIGWAYCGVYSDEALTGTKSDREGFQQMLTDCRAGKIDMVITKSISRFARNTVTLLETVRELKNLGIDVFFEEQNIRTMSADGELMLTILASYAQEESRSVSENQKWRVKRNFEAGIPWNGRMLGYRMQEGKYCIIPEEAELVRRIYREFLDGMGRNRIAARLNEEGIQPTRYGEEWHPQTIAKILRNYAYTGNLLLQRFFCESHITKKMVPNVGQKATLTTPGYTGDTYCTVCNELIAKGEVIPCPTGWLESEQGRQYYKNGELQKTGWTVIDGNTYYLDTETGYAATGIATLVPDGATEEARCVFDGKGVFQKDVTGVYSVGNDTYWLNSGIIEEEAGLKRVVKENGEVNYYYFAVQKNLEEREGLTLSAAVKSTVLNGKDCWLHKTNGLALPEWGYYFDENGVILHDEDTGKNGILKAGEDLFYYVDGIKAPAGMIKIGDDYYYANSKGQLIVNQTYYCSRMNGLMEEGTYAFDAKGKLIPGATDKNGIVKDDDGVLRYYVNGKVTYVGLIEIDGDFYYVRSSGEVVNDCVYYISWTHGLKEAGYYTFDENGKLTGTPKNGIVEEDGVLHYYVNGTLTYAGLIKIGDDYYYVNSKCEVVRDCDYYISWTHDLMPQGRYHFDADGKLTGSVAPLKNGIYEEDGSLYFYRNGERTYAGLIQIDGDYYYVRSTCEVVHDRSYYVYWTHGLMPEGYYNFDSAGRMILDSETE